MNSETIQMSSIGQQITAACAQKSWDFKKLADETDIPLRYLKRYQNGTMPTGENRIKIENKLGIQLAGSNGVQKRARPTAKKQEGLPSENQKFSCGFTSESAELSAKGEGNNIEIKVKYLGSEISVTIFHGLHLEVKSENGDVFRIEPREEHLQVSCRSRDLVASSSGGRNMLNLKQID